jgi:hypothetical protein
MKKIWKQVSGGIVAVTIMLQLFACSNTQNNPTATSATVLHTSTPPTSKIEPTPTQVTWPISLKRSKIASQSHRYISIDTVGTYNTDIITEEIRNSQSTLPDASNSSIPYWTGFVLENKIFINNHDERWNGVTDGVQYFYEDQIQFIADNGFNYARIVYSLSFLSNPQNILEVDEAELEQLDELISWGMKHNVHIQLSFTGLPGKQGTGIEEENVQSNDELFRDENLQEVVSKYLTMLARRYASIPNNNLSFELLAEPSVPDYDLNRYTKVLTPIIQSMWQVSPGRVLVVSDLGKQVPAQLAALGVSISLHNHIFTVDGRRLPDINFQPHWPMEYLPGFFTQNAGDYLTLKSETGFNDGKVSMYINEGSIKILSDGNILLSSSKGQTGWVEATFPEGTNEIQIVDAGNYVNFSAVRIEQQDRKPVTIVIHDLYTGSQNNKMPTILIKDDGTTQNIDDPQRVLNADFFVSEYLQESIDTAKKYNVGFLLTEVGTDTLDLSEEEYKAYHAEWLKALKANHIPWAYNCLHNVLAPASVLWLNQDAGFSNIIKVDGTPFLENKGIVDFLKGYQ